MVDIPTVLLAEFRTHRILTQGAAYEHLEIDDLNMSANSARAIPTNKYLQRILESPFIPTWTKNQKGMSGESLSNRKVENANELWLDNLKESDTLIVWNNQSDHLSHIYESERRNEDAEIEFENIGASCWPESFNIHTLRSKYEDLIELGVHKQNANRLLAPFAYTTCILSGTEWENFFELRCPKYVSRSGDCYKSRKEMPEYYYSKIYTEEEWQSKNKSTAQPEFQAIAEQIYDAYCEADWKKREYHIPFEQEIDDLLYKESDGKAKTGNIYEYWDKKMKISASMCAKLSYDTQENQDSIQKHLERADMLMASKHWEPFSHQATDMNQEQYEAFYKSFYDFDSRSSHKELGWCYNLRGFFSQRYVLENKNKQS